MHTCDVMGNDMCQEYDGTKKVWPWHMRTYIQYIKMPKTQHTSVAANKIIDKQANLFDFLYFSDKMCHFMLHIIHY